VRPAITRRVGRVAEDLEGIVTYDRRLAEAAADSGLIVLSPA
jgi:hypothetical protein